MTGSAMTIRRAREALGLSLAEVAKRVGASADELFDLEAYDDELLTSVKVQRIRDLLKVLALDVSDVFPVPTAPGNTVATYEELAQAVKDHLLRTGQSIGLFEVDVGWELFGALANPARFGDLNLDGLYAVAHAVRVDPRPLFQSRR